MASKSSKNQIGSWAFLIGVVLAVVLGVFNSNGINSMWTTILVIIGLIVGLFNITESETDGFLMAGLVMILATSFGQSAFQSVDILVNVLNALLVLFVPATILVAVKHVFAYARN